MRLSCRKGDPGYHRHAHLCCTVHIDGKEAEPFVVSADEERGHCLVYVTDKDGNIQWCHKRDTEYITAVYGKVEIKFKKGWSREEIESEIGKLPRRAAEDTIRQWPNSQQPLNVHRSRRHVARVSHLQADKRRATKGGV